MSMRVATVLIPAVCAAALAGDAALEFKRRNIDIPLPLLEAARDRLPRAFSNNQQRTAAAPPSVTIEESKVRKQLEEKLKHPRDLPGSATKAQPCW